MNNSIKCDNVLIALRKIIRAIDLHSKKLVHLYGLTGPQMIVLKAIHSAGGTITTSKLAKEVSLSQATISSIMDRLLDRGYVTRQKSTIDKRQTNISTTESANLIFSKNPTLLQIEFVEQFEKLKIWEQDLLLSSLERIADMMNAEALEADPLLANTELLKESNTEI